MATINKTQEQFLKHQGQTTPYSMLFEVKSAKGMYITHQNGKKYLDMVAGVSACSVGHSHPKVVEAVKNQAEQYMHTMVYGEFIQEPQLNLALTFKEYLPKNLNTTFFVNSGVEAIEAAIKLAKRVTGKPQIVSCKNSYHGSTNGALSIMGTEHLKSKFRPLLPECYQIEYNNIDSLEIITTKTAGVIIEPIQGASGFINPTQEFLQALRKKCNETGTLLIFDEIQTCFGRLGTMFGFETYGIIPDVLCIAKGMGGGMPIGAFISSYENMIQLSDQPSLGHINTFGGNAVCCAASLATWNSILEEKMMDSILEKEALFRKLLVHPKIKAIHGKGLALGIELKNEALVQKMFDALLEKQIITFFFLFNKKALRLSPPLIISKEEITYFCETFLGLLEHP